MRLMTESDITTENDEEIWIGTMMIVWLLTLYTSKEEMMEDYD